MEITPVMFVYGMAGRGATPKPIKRRAKYHHCAIKLFAGGKSDAIELRANTLRESLIARARFPMAERQH